MQLQLSDFNYHLPTTAIAQTPAQPRDASKLLQLNRHTGQVSDHHFFELDTLLPNNAVLVRNNTKVIPARLYGHKTSGGLVEILLTRRIGISQSGNERWECLTKPGLKPQQTITFGANANLEATCTAVTDYTRELTFSLGKEAFFAALYELGSTPIPPYIHWAKDDELHLRELYQTIYAKIAGSAAAPTAGLHFTPALEDRLRSKGVDFLELTLHVGLGTFLPVKTNNITEHHLHKEWFSLPQATAQAICQAKATGRPVFAVGTTTTRVLESCATGPKMVAARTGETEIYLYPPYQFQIVDGQITNFHLPKSTLLMMIAAFVSQPNTTERFMTFSQSQLGKAYQHAIGHNYRFYSFGDAMLIQ
jgi:S-adenosylmethionine:tRNA ribosyltransferase-isomerase